MDDDDDQKPRVLLDLIASMDAIHRANTGRGIPCKCGCGVTFLSAAEYFRHQSRNNHPSGRDGR